MVSKIDFKISAALLLVLGVSACDGNKTDGHYEGFYVSGSSASQVQTAVSAEVKRPSGNSIEVQLSGLPNSEAISFEIRLSGQSATLSSNSGFISGSIQFKKSSNGCYQGGGSPVGNQVCIRGKEIEVDLSTPYSKFILDQVNLATPVVIEVPQTYTLPELIERTKNLNFDNQVQFQSVMQAKAIARSAYLNLTPHLNVNSVLGIMSLNLETMARSAGDLIPFALPNRWFQAAALKNQSQADLDGYKIVQAEAMSAVQWMGYQVLADEQMIDILETNIEQIMQIRDQVLIGEQTGSANIQIGTSALIQSVLIALERNVEDIRENLKEQKSALSQGAGFFSPGAVVDLDPIAVSAISGPVAGAFTDWAKLASDRSLELLQLRHLVTAAKDTKDASYFQWLDPAGNDQQSFGLGLIDQVKYGTSTIKQVYDKINSSQSLILKSVQDDLDQSTRIYHDYLLVVEGSQNDQHTIDRLTSDFKLGIAFSISDLASALREKAAYDIAQVQDQFAYLTLQSKINFLTYSDIYASLLTEGITEKP